MDGAIYLTDNYRIRRIGPDLVIRTVAGKGISALPSGNGGPATDAFLLPNSVAVGTDGSIYVAETYQVRRVGPDGIIRPFAGSPGATLPGDGQPAVEARLHSAYDVTLDANGNAFIIDGGLDVIRRVDTQGIITTLAGLSGSSGYSGDLGPAKAATLAFLTHGGLAIGRDGELFIADVSNSRVRKVAGVLPGVGVNDITLPSRDGREIYVFSSAGKHLRTLDAFVHTPRPLYEFDYVAGTGELASVTDVDGKITRILRDPAGKFSGVQSPYGQVTSVQLNAQGYLEQVASPETDTFHFTYFDGGLLATKQDPRGSMSQYEYDELGRLTLDRDPPAAGGSQSLSRTDLPNGWSVERTTHLGRSTLYKVERLPTEDRLLTNTFPKPTTVTQLIGQDGKTTTSSPDGTVVVETTGPDPRFGLLSPVSTRETRLPSGLTRTESLSRQAQLANAVDLSSLLSYSETTTVNGRNAITSFHPSTLTFTTTSPANRQSFRTLNPRARLASVGQAGFLPSSLSYDALGRLETTTTGARTFTYDYDPHGFVHTIKDALDQATTFGTDAVGRITSIQHPNNTQTLLGYDASGNLSSLTPPGKPVHELDYTPVNLLETYTPPAAGLPQAATGYVYDEDRQLASMTRPDGLALQNMYDSAGRLKTTTLPTGIITYDYHPTSGQLSSVTGPYGQSIGFGYDGFLNRSVTASGTVAGSVAWTFDSDFRIATESINNTAATSFGYDADSLLTTAGGLTLTRDAVTGVLASSALGSVTDAFSYDNHGAVATYAASFNGAPLYAYNISARDNLGRITQKEETIGAATTTFAYSYDSSGRLTEKSKRTATPGSTTSTTPTATV